jgi:AraC family transcriptional regulator
MTPASLCGPPFGQPLRTLDARGFRIAECLYSPGQEIPLHQHERAGFCMVLDGGYQERTGRSRLECEPSTLLFHPAGDVHADVISDRGSRCLHVAIEPAVLVSMPARFSALESFQVSRRGVPHWLAFKLRAELDSRDDLTPIVVEGVGLALLAEFARRPGIRTGGAPPPWLERVKQRIHDEFATPLPLAELARTAGVHRVHLARAFREHYGCTVGEYIRQRRVELACRQLVETGTSLSAIALAAGFTDQSHFTTTFRRLVGVSPGDFRANLRRR